ncbi:MAG: hypothetical protein FK730_04695 [Asgard group archaeon]|nr:hypothetical protein [Asgard group archaeon]
MLFKKQLKFIFGIVFITLMLLSLSSSSVQVTADYNIKKRYSYSFYLETLKKPDGSNHFINFNGLFIHAGLTLHVKFVEVDPIIRYELTVGVDSTLTTLLTSIFIQETNWEELTLEYQADGYVINETDEYWNAKLNSSAKIDITFNKKDGVVQSCYAFNESQLVQYLSTGEIYFYRTGQNYGFKWTYSFLVIIPIGGIVVFAIIYRQRIAFKEKMMEAN